jgi:hypothetical protein
MLGRAQCAGISSRQLCRSNLPPAGALRGTFASTCRQAVVAVMIRIQQLRKMLERHPDRSVAFLRRQPQLTCCGKVGLHRSAITRDHGWNLLAQPPGPDMSYLYPYLPPY